MEREICITMGHLVKIHCVNSDSTVEVEMGTSLVELAEQLGIKGENPFLAAYVSHKLKELSYRIYTPAKVEFFDITHLAGFRVYQRSLIFIMQAAVSKLYPSQKFHARHAIGDSIYCEVEGKKEFSEEDCKALYEAACEIVRADTPITREKLPTEDVVEEFAKRGFDDKIDLLQTRQRLYSTVERLGDEVGYFFGALVPSTGYISRFEIHPYFKGFYVSMPSRTAPDTIAPTPNLQKMFSIFDGYSEWVEIMGVPTVGKLNKRIEQFEYEGGHITNYEMESAALQGMAKMMGHHAITICSIIANRVATSANPNYKTAVNDLVQTVLERLLGD